MRNAVIHSSGFYVPEKIISNKYFDDLLGEEVSPWLEKHVQIYERRWCADNESTADLAKEAIKNAMQNGGVKPEEIDLLIIATDTPEFISPSTSSKVQFELGLINAGTFDVNTACAGFVTALDMASKYIRDDEQYKTVAVVGAYAMSKYLNMLDKKTVNLFADGAGAFILKAEENSGRGFLASRLITKGQYYDYMGIFAGGTFKPISAELVDTVEPKLQIRKKFPPELNPEIWSDIAKNLSDRTNIPLNEVDMYFLTQININSIFETMEKLNQPKEKAQTSMHYYGYTGSACIPIAFCDALEKGKIKRGDNIFFIGSGGGLAFAGTAFKY
ncbi:MAG: ketoacyl-ACP synthase III [Ignavibacteriae bacterium HGW-Ignavibacteriae-2]|jgi:3-oxoacyl-[acyl-carrier-protein] synthase-3|nr:MAG: ketoacyl-ACP synthase III [Ignavibacteriae bacterium HGW-Ignavibacteriae-2]